MQTVKIIETFTGGPDGRRPFRAGDVVEISDADAKLYIAKGHARAVEEDAPKPKKDAKP